MLMAGKNAIVFGAGGAMGDVLPRVPGLREAAGPSADSALAGIDARPQPVPG